MQSTTLIIALTGLNEHVISPHLHDDLVVSTILFVRGEAEAVLITKSFSNPVVDVVKRHLFRQREIATARLPRKPPQNLFRIYAGARCRVFDTKTSESLPFDVTEIASKFNRINERVCSLYLFDRFGKSSSACTVGAVRQEDERFAARTFAHQLLRYAIDRIEQFGADTMRTNLQAAAVFQVLDPALGKVNSFDTLFKRQSGRGDILCHMGERIEIDDKRSIFALAQEPSKQVNGSLFLVIQSDALRAADIDHQTESQWKLGSAREMRYGLCPPLIQDLEILFCQIGGNVALLAIYRGEQTDDRSSAGRVHRGSGARRALRPGVATNEKTRRSRS